MKNQTMVGLFAVALCSVLMAGTADAIGKNYSCNLIKKNKTASQWGCDVNSSLNVVVLCDPNLGGCWVQDFQTGKTILGTDYTINAQAASDGLYKVNDAGGVFAMYLASDSNQLQSEAQYVNQVYQNWVGFGGGHCYQGEWCEQ